MHPCAGLSLAAVYQNVTTELGCTVFVSWFCSTSRLSNDSWWQNLGYNSSYCPGSQFGTHAQLLRKSYKVHRLSFLQWLYRFIWSLALISTKAFLSINFWDQWVVIVISREASACQLSSRCLPCSRSSSRKLNRLQPVGDAHWTVRVLWYSQQSWMHRSLPREDLIKDKSL